MSGMHQNHLGSFHDITQLFQLLFLLYLFFRSFICASLETERRGTTRRPARPYGPSRVRLCVSPTDAGNRPNPFNVKIVEAFFFFYYFSTFFQQNHKERNGLFCCGISVIACESHYCQASLFCSFFNMLLNNGR